MKISPKYQNKELYIQMMNDLVAERISGIEFSDRFLSQRTQDLDAYGKFLLSEEGSALNEAHQKWLRDEIPREEYIALASTVVWPIENLFFDLYDIIQSNDIEDFRAYFYARKYRCARDIAKDRRVDEKELRRRIKEKLDLLEANKGKW